VGLTGYILGTAIKLHSTLLVNLQSISSIVATPAAGRIQSRGSGVITLGFKGEKRSRLEVFGSVRGTFDSTISITRRIMISHSLDITFGWGQP
jgi:hypothetical protein